MTVKWFTKFIQLLVDLVLDITFFFFFLDNEAWIWVHRLPDTPPQKVCLDIQYFFLLYF